MMKSNVIQKAIQLLPDHQEKHYTVYSPNTALSSDLRIDILNSGGKELPNGIAYWQLNSNTYQVDLSGLPGGVYHLRILDNETYFVKRIILQ